MLGFEHELGGLLITLTVILIRGRRWRFGFVIDEEIGRAHEHGGPSGDLRPGRLLFFGVLSKIEVELGFWFDLWLELERWRLIRFFLERVEHLAGLGPRRGLVCVTHGDLVELDGGLLLILVVGEGEHIFEVLRLALAPSDEVDHGLDRAREQRPGERLICARGLVDRREHRVEAHLPRGDLVLEQDLIIEQDLGVLTLFLLGSLSLELGDLLGVTVHVDLTELGEVSGLLILARAELGVEVPPIELVDRPGVAVLGARLIEQADRIADPIELWLDLVFDQIEDIRARPISHLLRDRRALIIGDVPRLRLIEEGVPPCPFLGALAQRWWGVIQVGGVNALERFLEIAGTDEHRLNAQVHLGRDLIHRHDIEGIDHREQELGPFRVVSNFERDRLVTASHFDREQLDRLEVGRARAHVDPWQAQEIGDDLDDRRFLDEIVIDQRVV